MGTGTLGKIRSGGPIQVHCFLPSPMSEVAVKGSEN